VGSPPKSFGKEDPQKISEQLPFLAPLFPVENVPPKKGPFLPPKGDYPKV